MRFCISMLVLIFLVSGCATPSLPVSQQTADLAQRTMKAAPPNASILNVVSTTTWNTPLCVDDQKVGVLSRNTRAHLVLSPGRHIVNISTGDEPDCAKKATLQPDRYNSFIFSATIDLLEGKNHFLMLNQNTKKIERFFAFEPTDTNVQQVSAYPLLVSYIAPNADLSLPSSDDSSSNANLVQDAVNGVGMGLEAAKAECTNLGFELGTGEHGNCVLELLD